MPILRPQKSGVHRRACLALYRALLKESSRVAAEPLPFAGRNKYHGSSQESSTVLCAALQRQFRDCVGIQKHRQIIEALNQGYEALSFLRSIISPLPSSSLAELVSQFKLIFRESYMPAQTAASTPETAHMHPSADVPPFTPSGKANSGPRVWPHASTSPTTPHILQRPLPRSQLTGKRQVPRFVLASGMSFLRIKKPQPAYLSRIIRDRKVAQQKRVDQMTMLRQLWQPLAEHEDEWERAMQAACHREGSMALKVFQRDLVGAGGQARAKQTAETGAVRSPLPATYRASVQTCLQLLKETRAAEKERTEAWGQRLWRIMMEERRLKLEEEGVLVPLTGWSAERKAIIVEQRQKSGQLRRARMLQEKGKRPKPAGSQDSVDERSSTSSSGDGNTRQPFKVQLGI